MLPPRVKELVIERSKAMRAALLSEEWMTQTEEAPVLANRLGDLTVMADPPAKMWKALAAISARAHAAYDECSGFAARHVARQVPVHVAGGARLPCRDRLRRCHGAQLLPLHRRRRSARQGDLVGRHRRAWTTPEPEKFNGHAVCSVPSLSLLIDTTVYQAIRPHWGEAVSGMAAIKYHSRGIAS